MKLTTRRWILLLPILFAWGCAKPPAIPFVGNWENTHPMKGGQFITQIVFDPGGTGQVQQISHMTGKAAKKISDSVVIRPMHWHSDGDRYVILLYQPEGSGQARLEWSISNDGKVLSLIHADNSADVYYRPGAQGSSTSAGIAGAAPGKERGRPEEGTDPESRASASVAGATAENRVSTEEVGRSGGEKRLEALLESQ